MEYISIDFLRNSKLITLNESINIKIILISLFVTLIIAPNAYSASYYVDNTATGSNNGTSWANAWQSFAAITWGGSGVTAGDTLYISGGSTTKTYSEQLNVGTSGTSGNPVTISTGQDAGHNGKVVIDSNATSSNCIRIWGENYITITGEKTASINMKCVDSADSGILVYGATNIKITYIEVDNAGTGSGDHGIQFSGNRTPNSGNEISYCSVHDSYQDEIQGGTGIASGYAYISIHHNNLYNISDDGIQSGGGLDIYNNNIGGMRVPPRGSGHPDSIQAMGGYVRIYNNVFTESGHANIFVDPINVSGLIVENIYVYNNIFEGESSGHLAIKIKGDTPNPPDGFNNVYVFNNTIIDMGTSGITLGNKVAGADGTWANTFIYNNIVYNSSTRNSYAAVVAVDPGDYDTSDIIIDYNTINEGHSGTSVFAWKGIAYSYDGFIAAGLGQTNGNNDVPMFVSYTESVSGNDLRLSSLDTLSKDRGIDLSAYFNTDFNGVLRPKGFAWDIGATEHVPGGTTPKLPTGLNSR